MIIILNISNRKMHSATCHDKKKNVYNIFCTAHARSHDMLNHNYLYRKFETNKLRRKIFTKI